jgi:hypothetical protein
MLAGSRAIIEHTFVNQTRAAVTAFWEREFAPTRYAHSGDASIAYQTLGEGPCGLVLVTGPVSHMELMRSRAPRSSAARIWPLGAVRRHLSRPGHRPGPLRVAADGHDNLGGSRELLLDANERSWGDGTLASLFAPSQVDNREFVEWWGRMQCSAVTPGMTRKLMDMTMQTNLRDVLPTVRVPTIGDHGWRRSHGTSTG